ncbi:hypothetical protein [Novosphingobium pokkalii]|uniref:Uncharacterized protein n=1 Tax=Novosphingobium pokkalii TaxID=1770194 RepID=A0ABV7V3S0_9SPHN|nr:hypothetical protein [Novosphingobium pokkalii]GHC90299.1 hypothetical protein GCM10019060_14560 [Novosphingobium pokkalii]
MDAYFASGHAADGMLVALLLEAAWLLARGRPPGLVCVMLGPGALMVLGLRGALTGAAWPWIALPLALSLPLHLADPRLWQRGERTKKTAGPLGVGPAAREGLVKNWRARRCDTSGR